MPSEWLSQDSILKLQSEVHRARTKFPQPEGLVAALFEEFGEMCEACQDYPESNFRAELLQVACVAMRLYEESDPLLENRVVQELLSTGRCLEAEARFVLRNLIGDAAAAKSEGEF